MMREIQNDYCQTLGACAWCDCVADPTLPGCDVLERDAEWIAGCYEGDGSSAELAQLCLDGDPECADFIEAMTDIACAFGP